MLTISKNSFDVCALIISKKFFRCSFQLKCARPLFEKSASSSSTNHRPPSTPTPCRPIRRRNHSRPPAEVTLADQPRQHSHRPALQQPAPAAHRHLQLLSRTTPPKKATHCREVESD
ncbi:unnamed protein product [Trichogramma brassicae]|uniref:Uncharacterized protein n=1 Tax=Trichogramma brassicae TaxID=86971 RepID=A0A6H5J8G8_9HYME|nr:unnamed protein product [Trichogramma brassicae]